MNNIIEVLVKFSANFKVKKTLIAIVGWPKWKFGCFDRLLDQELKKLTSEEMRYQKLTINLANSVKNT